MIDIHIRNLLLTRDFPAFLAKVVETVSPSTEYLPNWHIELICEYLLAVEKGDIKQLIVNIAPRHLKPLDVNTSIAYSGGMYKALKDVKVGDKVLTHKGRYRTVLAIGEQGLLPTIKIKTNSGREIVTALDHPFLTPHGWIEAKDLKISDVLGIVVPQEDTGVRDRLLEEYRMAGYFVGDGQCGIYGRGASTVGVQTANITCHDEIEGADIIHCSNTLGWKCNLQKNRYNLSNGARKWLEEVGLAGKKSATKVVPDFVFQGDNESIANFIGAYYNCDGTISSKNRSNINLSISSISKELLIGTQKLLVRLGIYSRLRKYVNKNPNAAWKPVGYVNYSLDIGNCNDVEKFERLIPLYGIKKERLAKRLEIIKKRRTQFDNVLIPDYIVDIIPHELTECRCLKVEEDESFTAQDIAVHNSITVSVAWPAWLLGHNPAEQIICASYSQALSQKHSNDCRRVIQSEWYQEIFPKTQLSETQNTQKMFVTTMNGHRYATSVGGTITGLGGNVLIVDDALSADEALSTRKREVACQWFDQTLYSRLNNKKTGKIVVIEQRLHEQDLTGYLLKKQGWTHLSLPIIAEKDEQLGLHFKKYERKEGELLHPENMGWDEVNRTKSNNPDSWSGQYQQRPVMPGGAEFKLEWLQFYENLRDIGSFNKYIFVDPASAQKKHSDYTVMMVLGFGKDGNVYLIDMIRDRLNLTGKQKALFALQGKYKPLNIFYQKYGIEADIEYFKEVMEQDNYRFTITPVSSKLEKVDRILRLQPYFANGKIYMPKNLYRRDYENNNKDLIHALIEDEYLKFTKHNRHMHDDMLDTMAMFISANVQYPNEAAANYYKLYDKLKW